MSPVALASDPARDRTGGGWVDYYRALGLRLVPCRGKQPRGSWKQWQERDLTDEEWAAVRRHAEAGGEIGCVTGAASGVVVLDLDTKNNTKVADETRELLGDVAWQALPRATTPSGGLHLFAAHPGYHVGNSADRERGVDIRGDGGFVVLPSGGGERAWDREQPASAAWPPFRLLTPAHDRPEAREHANGGLNGGSAAPGAKWEPLDLAAVFGGVPAGGRDEAFFRFACSLRSSDTPYDDAVAQVVEAHAAAEQPPGDEFPLDVALEKLQRVYRDFPAGHSGAFAAEAEAGSDRPNVATALVRLAEGTHEFVMSEEGEAFAVPLDGPRIAQPLRGNQSFRRTLAARYFADTEKAASSSALADALGVLEGRAYAAERARVSVRLAAGDASRVTLDLGDNAGRSVVVTPGRWETVEERGPTFRRTALTSPVSEPVRGGSLDPMRELLNISDESWDLLVGYMVAAWVPEIPHPVLWLTGEQGTGKTSALRMIASLLDPSPAQTRTPPRDIQEWVVTLSGSWVVPVDNVSRIPDWLSDAICRAATGDGLARRQLYGDNDIVVNQLRNVVLLNGIGVGGLRGDLGDRLVPIELERIPASERRPEIDMRREWEALLPSLVGALLDVLAATLEALPEVRLESLPRMADFARVLAAVDEVLGSDSLAAYTGSRESISEQVVEGDSVAVAVRSLAAEAAQGRFDGGAEWTGTATDLLREIERLTEREHRGRDWPTNAQALSARLRRVAPDLSKSGVQLTKSTSNKKGKLWRLALEEEAGQ